MIAALLSPKRILFLGVDKNSGKKLRYRFDNRPLGRYSVGFQSFKNVHDSDVSTIVPILLQTGDIRILVYPGDHPPIHVHVVTKDRSLEVKVDISGSEPIEMRPAKDERMKTTAKHTRRALMLCRDNLEMLKAGAEKYYAAQ